ncbi:hypothetical protein EGR_11277 [Echinococcus granulosus]|uniref:Uncharacterized protein n=1 Tax=Echinococcus granulosus TaxID=6210 RepID=W6U6A5_ECHGR|nr:hypothetical protein EGR_11277 [Echinococcus granulosus]EUB53872.1 hypothetical protein EGR_11277 [Echinococcus granulosus]
MPNIQLRKFNFDSWISKLSPSETGRYAAPKIFMVCSLVLKHRNGSKIGINRCSLLTKGIANSADYSILCSTTTNKCCVGQIIGIKMAAGSTECLVVQST